MLKTTNAFFYWVTREQGSFEKLVLGLPEGGILLLENVRIYKEEEKNDPEFAKKFASLADLYVNDAFSTAHRAHASTEGVAKYLKPAFPGFLMQKGGMFVFKGKEQGTAICLEGQENRRSCSSSRCLRRLLQNTCSLKLRPC